MRLNEVVISGTRKLNLSSINLSNQKPMNTQLTIDEKKLRRGNAIYSFTKGKDHYQVIELFEKYRLIHNLNKVQLSKLAGYSGDHYSGISSYNSRFSRKAYNNYVNAINKLNEEKEAKENETKAVYQVTQPLPVYKPTPTINHKFELTEEVCIDFLKATGKYKISKCEITTNWIEL
jgi:hypothetical protein